MEIEKGITKLKVLHEGNKLTFQYPPFKGTYGDVANAIDKDNLKRPTSPETASLVYDAFQNLEGEYESQIVKILSGAWLWEFTGNLCLPKSDEEINNGVILEYNPTIENRELVMDKNNLIKRLKENDSNVKFVPFGFKTEQQSLIEFQRNPYIIARYGKEGAEKIADVASKYKKNPGISIFDSVNQEIKRMSALSWNGYIGGRLYVFGVNWYNVVGGHAFGICKDN